MRFTQVNTRATIRLARHNTATRLKNKRHSLKEIIMWSKPAATAMRFGFEVTVRDEQ